MNASEIKQLEGQRNRMAVWRFFRENPCHTKSEAAAHLGLTRKTVGDHCAAIKLGWRPPSGPKCGLCGADHV